jgi:hypothetical protein
MSIIFVCKVRKTQEGPINILSRKLKVGGADPEQSKDENSITVRDKRKILKTFEPEVSTLAKSLTIIAQAYRGHNPVLNRRGTKCILSFLIENWC